MIRGFTDSKTADHIIDQRLSWSRSLFRLEALQQWQLCHVSRRTCVNRLLAVILCQPNYLLVKIFHVFYFHWFESMAKIFWQWSKPRYFKTPITEDFNSLYSKVYIGLTMMAQIQPDHLKNCGSNPDSAKLPNIKYVQTLWIQWWSYRDYYLINNNPVRFCRVVYQFRCYV